MKSVNRMVTAWPFLLMPGVFVYVFPQGSLENVKQSTQVHRSARCSDGNMMNRAP